MSIYKYRVVSKHTKFYDSPLGTRRVIFAIHFRQRKLIKTHRLFNLDKRRF